MGFCSDVGVPLKKHMSAANLNWFSGWQKIESVGPGGVFFQGKISAKLPTPAARAQLKGMQPRQLSVV